MPLNDFFFFVVAAVVIGTTENITFVHLLDCVEIVALKKGWDIKHTENSERKSLVQLVNDAPPNATQLAGESQLSKVRREYAVDSIQKFQVCHTFNAAELGPSKCFNDIKKDVSNCWMKEEAVVPMPGSAAGAVIQAAWRLILVELGIRVNVVELNCGIPTEIFALDKGFPLID